MVFDYTTNYPDVKDEYIVKTMLNILTRKYDLNRMYDIQKEVELILLSSLLIYLVLFFILKPLSKIYK